MIKIENNESIETKGTSKEILLELITLTTNIIDNIANKTNTDFDEIFDNFLRCVYEAKLNITKELMEG